MSRYPETMPAARQTAELLRTIGRIRIRTRKTVSDLLAGPYRSAFRGAGMEFDTVREYVEGDDLRVVDWNVTARTGSPFVKTFREERERMKKLEEEWQAKLRQAEIDISLERAKLARERAEMEEKAHSFGIDGESSGEEGSKRGGETEKKPKGRGWRARLGLSDADDD